MSTTEATIREKLTQSFAPTYLEVENESHGHNVPKGSETHFRILVVSEKFAGLNRVARQRLVYQILGVELKSGVHALAQRTYSPQEWQALGGKVDTTSPACRGGSKS